MKIFIAADMDGAITVRMIKDNAHEDIYLKAKRSVEHMPAFGCELLEGEEKRLLEWVSK